MTKTLCMLLSVCALSFSGGCSADATVSAVGGSAEGVYELDTVALKHALMAVLSEDQRGDKLVVTQVENTAASIQGKMEIKADGTAAITMSKGPEGEQITHGTWTLAGDKLTIVTKKEGKDDVKVCEFQGDTVTLAVDQGGMFLEMLFRRQGQ